MCDIITIIDIIKKSTFEDKFMLSFCLLWDVFPLSKWWSRGLVLISVKCAVEIGRAVDFERL